jgi:hypothetical protein
MSGRVWRVWLTVLAALLAFSVPVFSEGAPDDESPAQLAAAFFRCGDADCAVRLFHFPPDYSAEELRKDTNGVRAVLELFQHELGRATEPNASDDPGEFIGVGIGGADAAYWKKHPDTSTIRYVVNFEKEGRGIVAIEACHIGSKWQIRSVHYGLPASRADAKQRIDAVYTKMMALP